MAPKWVLLAAFAVHDAGCSVVLAGSAWRAASPQCCSTDMPRPALAGLRRAELRGERRCSRQSPAMLADFISLGGKDKNVSAIQVAVLGGGSFGTAMACVLGRKGVLVNIIVRREDVARRINSERVNPYYQSDLKLPDTVFATTDAASAFAEADFIFHAVPVQFSRETLMKVAHLMPAETPVISLSKGIETNTLCLMSDVLQECLGEDRPFAFLSGPAFAGEIAQELVTAVTIASYDRDLANDLMVLLASTNFRALYSADVVGVEVGGAVKNVIAIAAGMCEGLGLGTNAMAALVTRGCTEMRRLVVVCGGEPATVFGLSGVGDTFGTCFGPLSRNR